MTATQASFLQSSTRNGFSLQIPWCSSHSDATLLTEVLAQEVDVRAATLVVAHGVDEQAHARSPIASIEAPRERDHLDVDGRVVRAERPRRPSWWC